MDRIAFLSHRVVFEDQVRAACVVVDPGLGKIVAITDTPPPNAALIDCGEDALLPGLVDTHVHFNEPGRSDWEGFESGTRAAAAGGITTVIDMPLNSLPETTTAKALEAKRHAAVGKCHVDWCPWGGAVNGNESHLLALAEAGVPGFKCFLIDPGCEGFGLIDEAHLRRAMPIIARTGLPLLVHAELSGPCDAACAALTDANWTSYNTWLASRPDAAELQAISLIIDLCREYDCRVHIVHLSSALALPMLQAARAEGLKLTVETCPHFLYFAAEDIADGATLLKCAPPIRSAENRERLWQGLREGIIDFIGSDHSPCPETMKTASFSTSWGGIASLSLGLPIVWTQAVTKAFSLCDLVRWMSAEPACLAGLTGVKGRIAVGGDADLLVLAPEEAFTVTHSDLWFRHPVSPYIGERLQGRVKQTYLRGHLIFDTGTLTQPPYGREFRP